MADGMTLFSKVESSNLPARTKSLLRQMVDKVSPYGATMHRAKGHVVGAAQGVRQGGESAIIGSLLGAAHVHLKTGLDVGKIPVDGVVGVAGLLAGVALAHEDVGTDLRNMGAAGITTYSFRKTYDFLAAKKRAKGEKPGGTFAGESDEPGYVNAGEDPIIAAARALPR